MISIKTIWSIKSNEEMCNIREDAEKSFPVIVDEESLASSAAFFKGLGDETRLKILSLLLLEDLCMCEIVAALNGATSTISHHLKIMEKGELIQSRREGKYTIYQANREKLESVLPYLHK